MITTNITPIFNPQQMQRLSREHGQTLQQLGKVEDQLKARFADMDRPIRAIILALASGEPLLFVGPPGTAKSRLIRALCGYLGIETGSADHPGEKYFEYLLTPFTEPNELFGFFEVVNEKGVQKLVRNDTGMMQHAQVVYLDEVFNGSSAILNSLLSFINEGIFHDRGTITRVKLEALFGSTNLIPQTEELRAMFDRFLVRCFVYDIDLDNKGDEHNPFISLVYAGWKETYDKARVTASTVLPERQEEAFPDLLDDLRSLRMSIGAAVNSGVLMPDQNADFYQGLRLRLSKCRAKEYSMMSNRRMVKMFHIMLIHCLYAAVVAGNDSPPVMGQAQYDLLPYFLDRWEDNLAEDLEIDWSWS